jgi:hypothetical protein
LEKMCRGDFERFKIMPSGKEIRARVTRGMLVGADEGCVPVTGVSR